MERAGLISGQNKRGGMMTTTATTSVSGRLLKMWSRVRESLGIDSSPSSSSSSSGVAGTSSSSATTRTTTRRATTAAASPAALKAEKERRLASNVNFFMRELEVVTSSSLDDHPARVKSLKRARSSRKNAGASDGAENADGADSDSWHEWFSTLLFRIFGDEKLFHVHPQSPFHFFWTGMMLFVTLYSTFTSPYFWAFKLVYVIPPTTSGQLMTILLECVMYFLLAMDVAMGFMTGYYHMGGIVMDRSFIRRHYIRNGLLLDALPLVPSIILFLPPRLQLFPFVAFIKGLQLLKLHNIQDRMWVLEEVIVGSVLINTLWLVLLQLAITLFIVANILACIWFWVQDEQDDYVGGIANSWLASNPDLSEAIQGWLNLMAAQSSGDYRNTIADVDDDGTVCSEFCVRYQLYIACLYWATSSGDSFSANSTPERLTAIGGQIVIVNAVASFIIAGVMSAMEDFNDSVSKRSLYRSKIERVNVYMERNGIPKEMRKLIRSYYRDVWVRKQIEFNDSELLEELPSTVKFPVMKYIVQGLVKSQSFFQDYLSSVSIDETVIDDLAMRMKPQFASTNEYIINQGETGTDLYMIKTGKVAVEVNGVGMVATMASGAYFGDIALIQASTGDSNVGVRTASIRAITYCELFVLTKDDVIYVWDRSPELRKAMEAVMLSRVSNSKAKSASSKSSTDEEKANGTGTEDKKK